MFCIQKGKIYPANVSKHNSKCEKQKLSCSKKLSTLLRRRISIEA